MRLDGDKGKISTSTAMKKSGQQTIAYDDELPPNLRTRVE